MLTIKRSTGGLGWRLRIKILVNDVEAAAIKHQESITLALPAEGAILQVTQTGSRSNQLHVMPGDVIEIGTTNWLLYCIIAVILFQIISIVIDAPLLAFLSILMILLISLANFFVEGFHYQIRKV